MSRNTSNRRVPAVVTARRVELHLRVGRGLVATLLSVWLGAGAWSPSLHAQDPPAPAEEAETSVPASLSSPRATLRSFIAAVNDAIDGDGKRIEAAVACLDLSDFSELTRDDQGPALAFDLKEVIDKLTYVDLDRVPDDATGDPYVLRDFDAGRIVVARVDDGRWLFERRTVAAIPAMLEAVAGFGRLVGTDVEGSTLLRLNPARWLRERVPESLAEPGFLGLELYKWIGLAVLAFASVLLDRLAIFLVGLIAERLLRRERLSVQRKTMSRSLRPFGLVVLGFVWKFGLPFLGLPDQATVVLKVAAEFLVAAGFVWGSYRLVDIVGEALESWSAKTASHTDDLVVPLLCKSLKVFIVVVGLVFLAHELKFNVVGLLTGLGLGGLAFALAAQDVIKNLFGSFMIISDGIYKVGDWVDIGGDVEGTVEQVGFRSTRIRTFYNSVISVPNSRMIDTAVDNLGARTYRRYRTLLSVTYDTPPEKIEALCEGIRELIRRHPYTRKDYYHVYLNGFAPGSLDILLYVFFETPEWNTELRERQRLMLDILRLAAKLGVEFAFPTQKLHIVQEQAGAPEPQDWPGKKARDEAASRGREQARVLLDDYDLGVGRDKPPPVRISVSEEEARGEG